jgi:methionine sulfoxide reductase heme-binding subunit
MPQAPAIAVKQLELEEGKPDSWQLLLLAAVVALDVGVTASGISSQTIWHLIRATGIAAYVLLTVNVVIGLLMSNRLLTGRLRTDAFEAHNFTALLVLGFGAFHALALLVDSYVGFSPTQILVPFTATYRPVAVAFGMLGLYGAAVIYFSFWMRHLIGYQTWRLIHYGTFVLFIAASLHGIFAGADSGASWMVLTYAASLIAVFGLTLMRVLRPRA